MDKLVVDILDRGGVKVDSSGGATEGETSEEHLSRHVGVLEAWLGFSNTEVGDDDDVMMEDAAPFDAGFYQAVELFLTEVWNPQESSQKYLDMMDIHRKEQDPTQVSLYTSVLSIRVTRLLRFWMDLNVMGRETMDVALDEMHQINNQNSFTFQLLKHCSAEESESNQHRHLSYPLIQALFGHVEQLHYLQSQIYLYTQALMRGGPRDANRAGKGLANPKARLAHMQLSQQVAEKLHDEFENHIKDLEFTIGEWYLTGSVDLRRQCRAHLGSVWSQFVARANGVGGGSGAGMKVENTSSSGIDMTLRILHRILLGTHDKLSKSHEHVLFYHLIPLHRPNAMVLWRDQTSLLDLYHEPLVQCIAVLLQKKPEWTARVINGLLEPDVWSKGGNTPKLVLLLHEIDTYIGCLPEPIEGNELGDTFPVLMRSLGACMASENSRLAQRALPFVKNQKFVMLMKKNYRETLGILLPFLLRQEPSWNGTVRKMTYNVLKILQDFDQELFEQVGDNILANSGPMPLPSPHRNPKQHTASIGGGPPKKRAIQNDSSKDMLPTNFTIKSAMGSWKPPSSHTSRPSIPAPSNRTNCKTGVNPPLGVTGVAPWAITGKQMTGKSHNNKNPPLGITGVAPWAMKPENPTHPKVFGGGQLLKLKWLRHRRFFRLSSSMTLYLGMILVLVLSERSDTRV
jgi:hypothetical protein